MLRHWLLVMYSSRTHANQAPVRRPLSQAGRSPVATPTTPERGRSPAIVTPTSFTKLLTPIGPRKRELKHIALQYCIRVLEQWERSKARNGVIFLCVIFTIEPPSCPDDDVIMAVS